jgi:hypothetical protein
MKLAAALFAQASDVQALRSLQSALPESVPADYFRLLASHDGLELTFDDVDWERDGYDAIRLFSVQEMLDMVKERWMVEEWPALVIVGSDSGGQFVAYDTSVEPPWPLVMYCPGAVVEKASVPLAASVTDLVEKWRPGPSA